MRKILVPMDGSKAALRALAFVAGRAARGEQVVLEVLYVQPLVIPTEYVSRDVIDKALRRERDKALADPRIAELTKQLHGRVHVLVGDTADKIVKFAKKRHCREIVMGTRGLSRLKGFLLGSIATKVVQLSPVPVTLVK